MSVWRGVLACMERGPCLSEKVVHVCLERVTCLSEKVVMCLSGEGSMPV